MRPLVIVGCCLLVTGCMKKSDMEPLPPVTGVVVIPYETAVSFGPRLSNDKVPALVAFIDSRRTDWTRAYGVGFGLPRPVYYAHLYQGETYIGYFGVGAGVLPGGAALFEVRYGKIYARKRVAKSEANHFLDLVGIGGELR